MESKSHILAERIFLAGMIMCFIVLAVRDPAARALSD